ARAHPEVVVGRVRDRVDLEPGDVALDDLELHARIMAGNGEGGSSAALLRDDPGGVGTYCSSLVEPSIVACEPPPIWIRRGFGSSGFATWISRTPSLYSARIEPSSVPCGRPIVRVNDPNRRS